jgi:hypothetical protein
MAAIGMGILWASYAIGLYGFSLVKGYENSFSGLINPLNPRPWSTAVYKGTGLFPPAAAAPSSTGSKTVSPAPPQAV